VSRPAFVSEPASPSLVEATTTLRTETERLREAVASLKSSVIKLRRLTEALAA